MHISTAFWARNGMLRPHLPLIKAIRLVPSARRGTARFGTLRLGRHHHWSKVNKARAHHGCSLPFLLSCTMAATVEVGFACRLQWARRNLLGCSESRRPCRRQASSTRCPSTLPSLLVETGGRLRRPPWDTTDFTFGRMMSSGEVCKGLGLQCDFVALASEHAR